jgi:hypothetical protein
MTSDGKPAFIVERRAASPEDIAIARGLARVEPLTSWLARVLLYLVIASALCYLGYAALDTPEGPPTFQDERFRTMLGTVAAVWAVLLGVCLSWRLREYRQKAQQRRAIEADLADEPLHIARVRPLDVVQLDYHRRLPTLVFRIGESQAVAVYLVNVAVADAPLPNTLFEYVRLGRTGHTLRLVPLGAKLTEVKHIDGAAAHFDALGHAECEPFDLNWGLLTRGATVGPLALNVARKS